MFSRSSSKSHGLAGASGGQDPHWSREPFSNLRELGLLGKSLTSSSSSDSRSLRSFNSFKRKQSQQHQQPPPQSPLQNWDSGLDQQPSFPEKSKWTPAPRLPPADPETWRWRAHAHPLVPLGLGSLSSVATDCPPLPPNSMAPLSLASIHTYRWPPPVPSRET
jgi:hypothetical protein